jgi:hypothetical protein
MAARVTRDIVADNITTVSLYVDPDPEYPTDFGRVILSNPSNQLRLAANDYTDGATTLSVLASSSDQKITIQPNIGDCQFITTKGNFNIQGGISFGGAVSLPPAVLDFSVAGDHIIPITTNTYNIGSASKYFLNAYIDTLTTNVTQTMPSLSTSDSIFEIASGNGLVADTQNVGFSVEYKNSGAKYAGLIRSYADGGWKLFKDASPLPNEMTDFSAITRGDIEVGSMIATSFITPTVNIGTSVLKTVISQSLSTSRTFTLPDANSVSIVSSTAPSDQFLTAISASGVLSYAQPAFSNLAGSANLASQISGILTIAKGGTNSAIAISSNRLVVSSPLGTSIRYVAAMADGQLAIGRTGDSPSVASLTGTTDQISVFNSPGNITLFLPQSIAPASSPTFASATFSNLSNMIVLGTTNTYTLTMPELSASRILTLPNADSTTIVSSTAPSNNFATGTSSGVISYAQPAFSDISGTASLLTQINGILPIANGGTNSSTALAGSKFMVSNVASTQIEESSLSMTDPSFTSVILTSGFVNNTDAISLPSATGALIGRATSELITGVKKFSTAPVFTAASNHFSIRSNNTGFGMIFTTPTPATASRTITFPDPINAAPNVAYWDSAAASVAAMVKNQGALPSFYIKADSGEAQVAIDTASGTNVQHIMSISGTIYWNMQCVTGLTKYRIFDQVSAKEQFTILRSDTTFVGINATSPGATLDVGGSVRASTQLSCTATTNSSSTSSGSIITSGGIGCMYSLYCGENIVFPSGGASNLNWYQQASPILLFPGLTSAFAADTYVSIICTRIGRIVTIYVSQVVETCYVSNTSPSATSSTPISAEFRPAIDIMVPMTAFNNTTGNTHSMARLGSDGVLTVWAHKNLTTQWGTTDSNGWYAFSITFSV